MRHHLILSALLAGLCFSGVAAAQTVPDISTLTSPDFSTVNIQRMADLPISGMRAVESDGQILYVSSNGRFVISGQIYDIWQRKPLDTMEQIQAVTSRMDLDAIGLEPEDLNTFSEGSGEKEVVVFVDPRCPYCHALIKDSRKYHDDYRFHFVVVPALGDESDRLARLAYCAEDKSKALNAMMDDTLSELPQQDSCDLGRYKETLVLAQLLEISGVPFVISHDGRISEGVPGDLDAWLRGE